MDQIGGLKGLVAAQLFGAGDADDAEGALFQFAEEVEEPYAEDDFETDQIEEADPGEAETDDHPHGVFKPPEAG